MDVLLLFPFYVGEKKPAHLGLWVSFWRPMLGHCEELPLRAWIFSLIFYLNDQVITESSYKHFMITERCQRQADSVYCKGQCWWTVRPSHSSFWQQPLVLMHCRAWPFSAQGAVPTPAAPTSATTLWGHPRAPSLPTSTQAQREAKREAGVLRLLWVRGRVSLSWDTGTSGTVIPDVQNPGLSQLDKNWVWRAPKNQRCEWEGSGEEQSWERQEDWRSELDLMLSLAIAESCAVADLSCVIFCFSEHS